MTRRPAIRLKAVCPSLPSQARQRQIPSPKPDGRVAIRLIAILHHLSNLAFNSKSLFFHHVIPIATQHHSQQQASYTSTILRPAERPRPATGRAGTRDGVTLHYATFRAAGYLCAPIAIVIAIADVLAPLVDPSNPTLHPTFDPLIPNAATATYRPGAIAHIAAPPPTSTLHHTHHLLGSQCWALARNGCRHRLRLSCRLPSPPMANLLYIQFSRPKSWDRRGRGGGLAPPFAFTAEELATPKLATSPAV